MKKEVFEEDLKELFTGVVPDPLQSIKQDPRFKVPEKKVGFSIGNLLNRKVLVTAFSVFLLALVLITSINRFSEPVVASTVTIDINPSIVITLDKDDYIINVTASNADAEIVLEKDVRYKGLTIEAFVEILIQRLEETNYIVTSGDDYNVILINVDSEDETISTQIQARFRNEIDKRMNAINASHWVLNSDDITLTDEETQEFKQQFQNSSQSKARLVLVYRLSLIQDEYTSDDLLDMSLIELYNLYIEYETPENLPDYDTMPGHNNPNK